jgi:hypothetical protein
MNQIKHPFSQDTKMAGVDFVSGFLKRQQPALSLRTPEATSAARASGFNEVVVQNFFKLFEGLQSKFNFPPSRIYNCDETGIMTVPNKQSKILSTRGKKQVGVLTSAERGTLVTAEICCNAAGNFVPPCLSYLVRSEMSCLRLVSLQKLWLSAIHPAGCRVKFL